MDISISHLTTKELQSILRVRGLPIYYKLKTDLVERLLKSMSEEKLKNSETSGHKDEENSVNRDEENREDSSEEYSEESEQSEDENMTNQVNSLAFRDIEESLECFSGEGHRKIEEWIAEFDKISKLCSWNDVQKYLYARRLLRSAAKLAVESQDCVGWDVLKDFLLTEFSDKVASIDIHKQLSTTKKTKNETMLEYYYKMQQIGNKGKIDEKSMIEYIVNGIPDTSINKAMMYTAKTGAELKEKMEIYAKITKETVINFQNASSSNDRKTHYSNSKRCKNCGAMSHYTNQCPDKNKGTRCFKCNQFGHMAPACQQRKDEIKEIKTINLPDMHVEVDFYKNNIIALVDTGSDITIIKKSIYEKMWKAPAITNPSKQITGIGQKIQLTYGSFPAVFAINNNTYAMHVNVLDDKLINDTMILGKDFLKNVQLIVSDGKVSIRKVINEYDLEENELSKIDVVGIIKSQEALDISTQTKDAKTIQEIRSLVEKYKPQRPDKSPVQLKLILTNDIPVYQKARRLACKEKEAVKQQIEEWLREGVIRRSISDFASPAVIVRKKDGSIRLCIDYRRLNEKIIKDRYPLPNMEDILEGLHEARVFTTLDLRNGFFHVDMHPDSIKYTSFIVPDGQYEFLKVPFGLCNSPAIFQRYINTIFHDLIQRKIVMLYLDDIIIPSKSEKENLEKLIIVLKVAEENGLFIKFGKCQFICTNITFLGHIVENGTIKPSQEKSMAIKTFPQPKNVKQTQRFLGLASYFRKFIENFSSIAKPLSDLTKTATKFQFGDSQLIAFETLKEKLCGDPVLKLYDPQLETELHTDASIFG